MTPIYIRSLVPLALAFMAAFAAAFIVADLLSSQQPQGSTWFLASLGAAGAASAIGVACGRQLVKRLPHHQVTGNR